MTPLLSTGSVAANNPYKYSNAATVSTRLLAPVVLDVIPHMCRVEFFTEPVGCVPTITTAVVHHNSSCACASSFLKQTHLSFWFSWQAVTAACACICGMLISKAKLSLAQAVRETLQYLCWENSELSVKVLDAVFAICKKADVQSLYQLAPVCLADCPMTLNTLCRFPDLFFTVLLLK